MFLQKPRIIIILFFFIVFSTLIIIRFFYLQIIKHTELESYAKREYIRKIQEFSPRGKIYDANGNILADSIITWDVVITTSQISHSEIETISKVTGIRLDEIKKKIKPNTRYLKIKKGINKESYDILKNIKSIYLEPHQSRIYPQDCAREIIGMSNENAGLSGIELIYDRYLRGNITVKEIVKDIKGNVIKSNEKEINDRPFDIYLTIEHEIQSIVEQIIEKHFTSLNAERIIAIVQDSKTGAIVAASSYPPNYINFMPFEYVYEPGSTIKTIILSAGFEENVISENDFFDCENGSWKINQKYTITDHEKLGVISLIDVYTHSSNIGFGKIGLKIGIKRLYPYIKKFGLGTKYTQFPGESKGIIKEINKYKDTELITTSYGYGIAITPLQLINAYTAIANRGELLNPYFIACIRRDKEYEIQSTQRNVIRKVISPQTAERVIKMMVDVVENGTGINARINGYTVAGKTGTANKLDLKTAKYIKDVNVGSFCGFFPASRPFYTILIIVDSSKKFKYGGQSAAPIFRDIAKQIISIKSIKPDRPFDTEKNENKKGIVLN
ncbi:MAG: peptidoglycan D,D-transpeptidase FtsI family protein [Elusimicrobiales bacterium]